MKIFDKASWHITQGIPPASVIGKLQNVYSFLKQKNLLSENGLEDIEFGIDESTSLNENTVTEKGNEFLTQYYDEVIGLGKEEIFDALEKKYITFLGL